MSRRYKSLEKQIIFGVIDIASEAIKTSIKNELKEKKKRRTNKKKAIKSVDEQTNIETFHITFYPKEDDF